jgi:hypothetical protein
MHRAAIALTFEVAATTTTRKNGHDNERLEQQTPPI